MEFDIAGTIAFRELGYGPDPDGPPLDPHVGMSTVATEFPSFVGEKFHLRAAYPRFTWPTVVLSGERDLRTPRIIVDSIVDAVPDSVLLPVSGIGHSILDCHPLVALHAMGAIAAGHRRLPGLADRLSALPHRGRQRMVAPLIRARLVTERLAPGSR